MASKDRVDRKLSKEDNERQGRIAELLAVPQRTRDEDKELARLSDPKDILEANGIITGATGVNPDPKGAGEEGDGEQQTNREYAAAWREDAEDSTPAKKASAKKEDDKPKDNRSTAKPKSEPKRDSATEARRSASPGPDSPRVDPAKTDFKDPKGQTVKREEPKKDDKPKSS